METKEKIRKAVMANVDPEWLEDVVESVITLITEEVEREKVKIFDMLCRAMSGKMTIKKSDFGEIVDYLDPPHLTT